VNVLDHPVEGAWRLDAIREARLSRLDETPLDELAVDAGRIPFIVPSRAIMTILAR
jgi:hypothetical protein